MPAAPTAQSPSDFGSLQLDVLAGQNDAALAETKAYEVEFTLNTHMIRALEPSQNPLEWDSIRFGKDEIEHIPDDRRGVYAFVIADRRAFLPRHGYVVYVGIAGRDSHRTLRARYEDYFKQSEIQRRPAVRRMIVTWHPILRFHFAPVDDDFPSQELKAIEKRLITAFLPPFCKNDIEADTKAMMSAFP